MFTKEKIKRIEKKINEDLRPHGARSFVITTRKDGSCSDGKKEYGGYEEFVRVNKLTEKDRVICLPEQVLEGAPVSYLENGAEGGTVL